MIELAGDSAEGRVFGDALCDLGFGQPKAQFAGALVECGFRHQLTKDLPVEAK